MTAINPEAPPPPLSPLPEEFQPLALRLEAAGATFRAAWITGAAAVLAGVMAPLLVLVLFVAGAVALPAWGTVTLLVVLLAGLGVTYFKTLHPVLFANPTYGQIARWVEENAGPGVDNRLINAVLLAQEHQAAREGQRPEHAGDGRSWIPSMLREADRETANLDLAKAVPWDRQWHKWARAAIAIVGALIFAALFHDTVGRGFAVLTAPGRFVPVQGRVKITSVLPGNDTLIAGQGETFVVELRRPDEKAVAVNLHLHFKSGQDKVLEMAPGDDAASFKYSLGAVAEDVDYYVAAGDSESERYHLAVMPKLNVTAFELEAQPPAYTGLPVKKITLAPAELQQAIGPGKGSMEVAQGTVLRVSARTDMPIGSAEMDVVGGQPVHLDGTTDRLSYTGSLAVKDNVTFAILLNDNSGRTLRRMPDASADADAFSVSALADQPPGVQVTEPGRDLEAKPGISLPLAATANDDYGLTELRLEIATGKDANFTTLQSWAIKPGGDGRPVKTFQVKYLMPLPASEYKLGDVVRYRFAVVDNRHLENLAPDLGPQTTTGQVFTVTFTDTAAEAAKTSEAWDQLKKKLQALLDQQNALHKQTMTITPAIELATAKDVAGKVGAGQSNLRADMATLAKDFPFETNMKIVQRTLQVLVTEDVSAAVDRAADCVAASDMRSVTPAAKKLLGHQARVIDVLESLLAIAASEQNAPKTITGTDGGDLPNSAKDAWKKMLADLKNFEKEQAATINQTADLAKKPKDQFDQNDQKKLNDLAAAEDKWEKFMNQAMVDMSKIAEQDQANASLLDEMVQMKVELSLAKNALDTKATQVAVPLEENGLENAKALDSHIERWLGHAPDRTQWQMEEPAGQNDAPMAELPKQLQDMIGDLQDQEEDETQQMESLASKWADSLNKGAGWDAADGPISNMSAQGVTGNQLPKNMEIQGRSGEGREGRSSGEFVGKEAEGKGGRRTPTRETQDPFSSGKVDDKSKEPAGGATGGGKRGQFGGEGLEGPAPEPMHDPMQRLQGKQANLRNEAERLKLQMRAQGFNNFKLLEASAWMDRADAALKSYRYQTALKYQEEAVQSLNTAKVLASGQMHVTMDTTPALSEKTQKDIEDAMKGAMPNGYADPVKAYFEKLSEQGAAPQ